MRFILSLKKKMYEYQFGQYAWTHMILIVVFTQPSFTVANIFEGMFCSLGSWKGISIMPVQWHALCLGLFSSIIAPFGGFFLPAVSREHSRSRTLVIASLDMVELLTEWTARIWDDRDI